MTFLLFSVEWYHPEPINFWMSLYFPLANNPSLPVAWQQFSHLATCLPGSSRHLADLLAICQGTARQLSGLLATLGQPSGQPWHPPETDGALPLVQGPSNGPIRRRRQGKSNSLLSRAGRLPEEDDGSSALTNHILGFLVSRLSHYKSPHPNPTQIGIITVEIYQELTSLLIIP